MIRIPTGKLFFKSHSFKMSKLYAKLKEKHLLPSWEKEKLPPKYSQEMLVLICQIILNYGAYRK